ncbi:MAG TPA: hypothetical protein VGL95_08485 [Acetobacteraceae bacterium]|jgi:hypothetical protein
MGCYRGLDFTGGLTEVDFTVRAFRLTSEQEVRYGLLRDEWLHVASES